ncbi:MAG TPA: hypothetical protein VGK74_24585 [Symbiobacteriaceae bacterium]
MTIIYPPTLDFSFMRQRPQQLMIQFARHGHRVFFCDKTQQAGREPEEVLPNLWVVRDQQRFVQEVVPGLGRIIVWCSWAYLHHELDVYRPDLVVFDCVDDFPEWRPYEAPMLARSAAVVATSAALEARLRPLHARVAVIPNGCDFAFFNTPPDGPPPRDLAQTGRPRVMFVGAWGRWVDSALVLQVSKYLPLWDFIMIGPEFGGHPIWGRNIYKLGMRPYERLPAYLHHANVAIIPFRDNQVTRAANPVKLWEYLATGRQVVSTPLPEVLPLQGLIRIAADPVSFARAIHSAAFDSESVGQRIAVAKANSWEARYKAITEFLPEIAP